MTYDPTNKWEIETSKEALKCSHCDNSEKPVFTLSQDVMATIRALCTEVEREWQVLLIGREIEGGIYCDGYIIPEQETTCASVINKADIDQKFLEDNSIVATCHSHGNIAVGFSHTDEVCTNFSWIKHHMVTNNKGDWCAISRVDLPCDMVSMKSAIVKVEMPVVKATDIKDLANISERKYVPPACGAGYGHSYGGYGGGYFKGTYGTGQVYKKDDTKFKPIDLPWKRSSKRSHAFLYDQDDWCTGGACGY